MNYDRFEFSTATVRITPRQHRVKSVTRARALVLATFVFALGSLAIQAAESKTVKMSMQPPKNFFLEQCFTLERGQKLSYTLATPQPIKFNLHHHPENGPTVFPDRLLVKSQHSKQITAAAAGEYCFMTTNPVDQPSAFDVVVSYEITTP